MARENFAAALRAVLKHEGGFVDHPKDPGGATNKGITLTNYRRYVKRGGTVADLKAITDDQVAKVYRQHYWDAVRADDLPAGVDYAVFDFGVNSGPSRAIKYLQAMLGVHQDGIIGPKTLDAVWAADPASVINALCDSRMAFLKGLPHWGTFGKGWTNRVSGVRNLAQQMVRSGVSKPKPSPVPSAPPKSTKGHVGLVFALFAIAAALAAFFIFGR